MHMEDSASMTIEFLRARLLSERSVSKTAWRRADDLAKRVMELEEELKIVTLQKKEAEKATADVLAILESHDGTDISKTVDSSSDQDEIPHDSKVNNNSLKNNEEGSVCSKEKRQETDEYSGSEFESSLVTSRSLSWKNSNDSPKFYEKKFADSSIGRHDGFASLGYSLLKKRPGRSCRQIRQKETSDVNHSEARSVNHSEGLFNDGPGTLEEQNQGIKETCFDGTGRNEMERALENQAQLIGRFQDEEKAQRDWEEKFREKNNSSTPDSCEPGSHSDVTEEKDECTIQNQGQKSKVESFHNQNENKTHNNDSPASEFAFSTPCQKSEYKKCLENDSSHHSSGFPKNRLEHTYSSPMHESVSQSQKQLASVLEALREASLSLKHKLNAPEHSFVARSEIPVGCAPLFKIPNDFQIEVSKSRSSLMNYYPYPENHFSSSPSSVTRQLVSTQSSRSFVPWLGVSDSDQSRARLISGSRQSVRSKMCTFPVYEKHVQSNGGLSGPELSSAVGLGLSRPNRSSLYDDYIRPNMYG